MAATEHALAAEQALEHAIREDYPRDDSARELGNIRRLLEAQVRATLAVASELEKQRLAGWGQRA